jgi:predicted transcriptional regulator
MRIGEVCNRNVVCASRDTAVVEAARLMRQQHVGDLVVVDEVAGRRTPVGIVTDRDIVIEVVAAGLDAKAIKVGDLLIGPLLAVEEQESCGETVRLMAAKGVRRMPVVDSAGQLAGIITVDDLLPQVATQLADLSVLVGRGRQREAEIRK